MGWFFFFKCNWLYNSDQSFSRNDSLFILIICYRANVLVENTCDAFPCKISCAFWIKEELRLPHLYKRNRCKLRANAQGCFRERSRCPYMFLKNPALLACSNHWLKNEKEGFRGALLFDWFKSLDWRRKCIKRRHSTSDVKVALVTNAAIFLCRIHLTICGTFKVLLPWTRQHKIPIDCSAGFGWFFLLMLSISCPSSQLLVNTKLCYGINIQGYGETQKKMFYPIGVWAPGLLFYDRLMPTMSTVTDLLKKPVPELRKGTSHLRPNIWNRDVHKSIRNSKWTLSF